MTETDHTKKDQQIRDLPAVGEEVVHILPDANRYAREVRVENEWGEIEIYTVSGAEIKAGDQILTREIMIITPRDEYEEMPVQRLIDSSEKLRAVVAEIAQKLSEVGFHDTVSYWDQVAAKASMQAWKGVAQNPSHPLHGMFRVLAGIPDGVGVEEYMRTLMPE